MDRQLRSANQKANFGVIEETRADGKKQRVLKGYAAVFNSRSEVLGWFREVIMPGAFAAPLQNKDDVRALLNHDANFVLARSTNGTLRMGQDQVGLHCEIDLPDTQAARDLATSIERGDISQMSFAFSSRDVKHDIEDGEYIRYVRSVQRLYDVSPVTYPAYQATSIGLRAMGFDIPLDVDKLVPVLMRAEEGWPAMKDDPQVVRDAISQLTKYLDKLMVEGERTAHGDNETMTVDEIGERLAALRGDVLDADALQRRLEQLRA